MPGQGPIREINAVTLVTSDMARAVAFYDRLGFEKAYGGEGAGFTSYRVGAGFLNLQLVAGSGRQPVWGRVIFWVDDVDAMHGAVTAAGYQPAGEPTDAPWGERYFHVCDPDGHELSFAKPL